MRLNKPAQNDPETKYRVSSHHLYQTYVHFQLDLFHPVEQLQPTHEKKHDDIT